RSRMAGATITRAAIRSARWSGAMSASCAATAPSPAARTRIATPTPSCAMAKLVRAAVNAEKKKRDREVEDNPETDTWLQGIEPSLLKLGPVTLAPSTESGKSAGLTFHFSPYMVGPYSDGPLTVFVPWTDFKDRLSPDGAALFGGTRPENDAAGLD